MPQHAAHNRTRAVGNAVGKPMAKSVDKLTARAVTSARKPGRHADGRGLYLNVTATGARSWLFLWRLQGHRREMGLGSAADVTLAEARELAGAARRDVREGRDPIVERDARRARQTDKTFGDAAADLIASLTDSWKNPKHRQQWQMTLTEYCRPIAGKPVSAIDTEAVLSVLNPLWKRAPETAGRLRGRIERVIDYATARGWRSGANPARWRGHLKSILPARPKLQRGHHKALAVAELPAFMAQLREAEGLGARALELLILTATRTGEAVAAEWSEIDTDRKVWTIPGKRMKAGAPHQVPLSDRAMAILAEMQPLGGRYVFPGKPGKPLSDGTLTAVLRRLRADCTVHGFRSVFRDWAGDHTTFPRELAEHALAHRVGDETERAYRRNSALERRRELMQAWANYCMMPIGGNVVVLRGSKGHG